MHQLPQGDKLLDSLTADTQSCAWLLEGQHSGVEQSPECTESCGVEMVAEALTVVERTEDLSLHRGR